MAKQKTSPKKKEENISKTENVEASKVVQRETSVKEETPEVEATPGGEVKTEERTFQDTSFKGASEEDQEKSDNEQAEEIEGVVGHDAFPFEEESKEETFENDIAETIDSIEAVIAQVKKWDLRDKRIHSTHIIALLNKAKNYAASI